MAAGQSAHAIVASQLVLVRYLVRKGFAPIHPSILLCFLPRAAPSVVDDRAGPRAPSRRIILGVLPRRTKRSCRGVAAAAFACAVQPVANSCNLPRVALAGTAYAVLGRVQVTALFVSFPHRRPSVSARR